MKTFKRNTILLVAAVLATMSLGTVITSIVSAASLQNTYVRLDRLKGSTSTTFRILFKVPSGNSLVENYLKVSFPDSFTVATSSLTASTANCAADTGATPLPGTLTVAGNNTPGSKNVLVSGVTNLTASSTYCVDIDRTSTHDPITNPGASQYSLTVATLDSGSAVIDTTSVSVSIVSDDQVQVSATVPPSFTFALDSNSTSFTSNLSSGSVVQTTGRTVTVTTNAANGYVVWAKDANTGLTSAAAGHTIASTTPGSAATLSNGTEGYVLSAEVTTDFTGGGTVSIPAAYQGTAGNSAGSGLDTTYRQIVSSNGTAGGTGDVVTVRGKAAISGSTQAGADYADTWTLIGAGTF